MREASRHDPMERQIEQALLDAGIAFVDETHPDNAARLDFFLPDYGLYIEVKRMHSPRIAEQTARAANVLVAQGPEAVGALARMIGSL